MSDARLALLHLCDSLFPVGAFAHSDGLETAVAAGMVRTAEDVKQWLDATLIHVLRPYEGPVVLKAMRLADAGTTAALATLHNEVEAMRPSRTAREASRAIGVRLLKTWQEIRPAPCVVEALATDCPFAFPIAFGIVAHATSIPVVEAIEGYCYVRLASAVSAAMRLMPLGQLQAHGALAAVLRQVPETAAAIVVDEAPARSFVPLMDLASMNHQYVHSRLFRS